MKFFYGQEYVPGSMDGYKKPYIRVNDPNKTAGRHGKKRAVFDCETKAYYTSASAAARATGKSQGVVSQICLRGNGRFCYI